MLNESKIDKDLQNLKELVTKEDQLEPSKISIYDLFRIYQNKQTELLDKEDDIKLSINDIVKQNFNDNYVCIQYKKDMDYLPYIELYTFVIGLTNSDGIFTFKMNSDGSIYISASKTFKNCFIDEKQLLKFLHKEIQKLFIFNFSKEALELREPKFLSIPETTLKISICENLMILYTDELDELIRIIYDNKRIIINYSSYELLRSFKENECDILKNIYVKIKDCPNGIRNDLYYYRYNYLKKLERDKIAQNKRGKTLELKIKSFIRKIK